MRKTSRVKNGIASFFKYFFISSIIPAFLVYASE